MNFIEAVKFLVPSVIVPLGLFVVNWIVRYNRDYSITAPADFLLAVMIFDFGVLCAMPEVNTFVHYVAFTTITAQWHIFMLFLSGTIWYIIVAKSNNIINNYYSLYHQTQHAIPFLALSSAWMGAWIVVVLHAAFFLYQGTGL
jgi:hypothetical protein